MWLWYLIIIPYGNTLTSTSATASWSPCSLLLDEVPAMQNISHTKFSKLTYWNAIDFHDIGIFFISLKDYLHESSYVVTGL